MFEKHLWKSDILSKDDLHLYLNLSLPQLFFKHYPSKSQFTWFLHNYKIGRKWVNIPRKIIPNQRSPKMKGMLNPC